MNHKATIFQLYIIFFNRLRRRNKPLVYWEWAHAPLFSKENINFGQFSKNEWFYHDKRRAIECSIISSSDFDGICKIEKIRKHIFDNLYFWKVLLHRIYMHSHVDEGCHMLSLNDGLNHICLKFYYIQWLYKLIEIDFLTLLLF